MALEPAIAELVADFITKDVPHLAIKPLMNVAPDISLARF